MGARAREKDGDGGARREELEGKMNSRWQSDNPGTIDRNICRSVGVTYTHRLYIETRLYIERGPCAGRGLVRSLARTRPHTHGCVYVNVSATLRNDGNACSMHECVYGVARFSHAAGTFQGSAETELCPAFPPFFPTPIFSSSPFVSYSNRYTAQSSRSESGRRVPTLEFL